MALGGMFISLFLCRFGHKLYTTFYSMSYHIFKERISVIFERFLCLRSMKLEQVLLLGIKNGYAIFIVIKHFSH